MSENGSHPPGEEAPSGKLPGVCNGGFQPWTGDSIGMYSILAPGTILTDWSIKKIRRSKIVSNGPVPIKYTFGQSTYTMISAGRFGTVVETRFDKHILGSMTVRILVGATGLIESYDFILDFEEQHTLMFLPPGDPGAE